MCTRFVYHGNVGTLLYVHGNPDGAYQKGRKFKFLPI
jgi:hypothetical protein